MKQYGMIIAGIACLAFLGIRGLLSSPEPEEEKARFDTVEAAPLPPPRRTEPEEVVEPLKLKLSPDSLARIRNATRDTTTDVRWESTRFLVQIQDENADSQLFNMLHHDSDPVNRMRVVGLLSQYNEPEVTRHLILALKDTDDSVRIAVLSALGLIGDYSAAKSIGGMVHDTDKRVRLKAIETLDMLEKKRNEEIAAAKRKHEEEMRRYEREMEERRRKEAEAQAARQE